MTVPRTLNLVRDGKESWVSSLPAPELWSLAYDSIRIENLPAGLHTLPESKSGKFHLPCVIRVRMDSLADLQMELGNSSGQRLIFGYSDTGKRYFINRANSGSTQFHPAFTSLITAPRLKKDKGHREEILVILDQSSVEFFADDGLTVMTALYFPDETPGHFQVNSSTGIRSVDFTMLRNIWTGNY